MNRWGRGLSPLGRRVFVLQMEDGGASLAVSAGCPPLHPPSLPHPHNTKPTSPSLPMRAALYLLVASLAAVGVHGVSQALTGPMLAGGWRGDTTAVGAMEAPQPLHCTTHTPLTVSQPRARVAARTSARVVRMGHTRAPQRACVLRSVLLLSGRVRMSQAFIQGPPIPPTHHPPPTSTHPPPPTPLPLPSLPRRR
jgi:hypothetical protein